MKTKMEVAWESIETAPRNGVEILCYKIGWDRPVFLVWKTNPRIVKAHEEGKSMDLKGQYFGDPDEMDDYDLAEEGEGPDYWIQLPPLPQKDKDK